MNDCGNSFEAFINTLHIKFGKLQILGYHNGPKEEKRAARSVNPRARQRARNGDALGSGSIFAASSHQGSIIGPG